MADSTPVSTNTLQSVRRASSGASATNGPANSMARELSSEGGNDMTAAMARSRVMTPGPGLPVRVRRIVSGTWSQHSPSTSAVISQLRSEEHTSELQSLMRISYAVFCLKKKHNNKHPIPLQKTQE